MSNVFRIFVLDDETWYGLMLKHTLQLNPDYDVRVFDKAADVLRHMHLKPHVVTIDYNLPEMNGDEVLRRLKAINPDLPVIVVSEQEQITVAIDLLKAGAYDYLIKEEDTPERLMHLMQKIREVQALREEVATLRKEVKTRFVQPGGMLGESAVMQEVNAAIQKAARSNITVSITGETGTGKEVAAKGIHYLSARCEKPFVAVNVAAIPKELIESELFGHEKGSFTNAFARRIGKFEEANGGTLFLDEIGELELGLQAKLLRVLQEREVYRIGGTAAIKLDVRIIVATHKNLLEEIYKGNFREDLYYRLLGFSITMPPLRDRGHDCLILARHFMQEYCKEHQVTAKEISPAAAQKLLEFSFPGNVRELKSVMELAVVLADEESIIEPQHIQLRTIPRVAALSNSEMSLKDYEIQLIQQYLNEFNYDVNRVAEKLKIGKSTIYRMVKAGELTLQPS